MKQIKNDTIRWGDVFFDRKNQYCQNYYTTKIIDRVNVTPIKLSMAFFRELDKKIKS